MAVMEGATEKTRALKWERIGEGGRGGGRGRGEEEHSLCTCASVLPTPGTTADFNSTCTAHTSQWGELE